MFFVFLRLDRKTKTISNSHQCRVDDSDQLIEVMKLFRAMFLTMLAKLERNDLLKADSEIKNVRLIMAQYIRASVDHVDLQDSGISEMILAYATKHNLDLEGFDADGVIAKTDEVELPTFDAANDDPWDWEKELAAVDLKWGPLGGDKYDITAWTSAMRKENNGSKDPLDKKAIDALKKGMVMQLA